MSRIVLDTNSLIQCISHRSSYHDIWLSVIDGRNLLCVSNEIIEEYNEILEQKTSRDYATLAVNVILNNPYTVFVTPFYHFDLIKADPDNNKFMDCDIAANAKFIVTEDHHYAILAQIDFPKVDIVKLDDMLKMLS